MLLRACCTFRPKSCFFI